MGMIDKILGRKEPTSEQIGMDPYGQTFQNIDPAIVNLMNSPQMQNAQIAQQATDSDEIIDNFRNGLRGFKEVTFNDPISGKRTTQKIEFGKPAMNDEGINELCAELQMYLSKTYILSNVPKEDKRRIDAMARIIWSSINQKLIINSKRYSLDKSRRPTIVHTMIFIIISNVMRGFEEGERGKYYGSNRVMQTITSNNANVPPPAKKNWFGL